MFQIPFPLPSCPRNFVRKREPEKVILHRGKFCGSRFVVRSTLSHEVDYILPVTSILLFYVKAENVYGNVQNYEKYNKLKLLPFTIRYQFGIYF